jgi:hypothetical protein
VAKASGGTTTASSGTSVATETCGQLSPPKSSSTVCEYWIWVDVTVMVMGTVIYCGGVTLTLEARPFGLGRGARMINASWSGVQGDFESVQYLFNPAGGFVSWAGAGGNLVLRGIHEGA